MNREIKFRGFYEITKTWFYGYLIPRDLLEDPHFLEPLWIATGMETECYPVDKDSIGQFTGLLDKNGKEIYEGDILKCVAKTPEREGQIFNNLVYWLKYRFRLKNNRFSADLTPNRIYNASAEIIGNVHENPELLK